MGLSLRIAPLLRVYFPEYGSYVIPPQSGAQLGLNSVQIKIAIRLHYKAKYNQDFIIVKND